MTTVRSRFAAVLLGVLCCLVLGSGQSFATPGASADAAPVAAPTSEEACGALTASVNYSSVRDEVWAAGSVRFACAGWDRLCVTLYTGAAVPVVTRCVPIPAGGSASTSARATCVSGWYYGQTKVYDNGVAVKQLTSARKQFVC